MLSKSLSSAWPRAAESPSRACGPSAPSPQKPGERHISYVLTVRKIRLLTETEISATGVAAEVTADEAPN